MSAPQRTPGGRRNGAPAAAELQCPPAAAALAAAMRPWRATVAGTVTGRRSPRLRCRFQSARPERGKCGVGYDGLKAGQRVRLEPSRLDAVTGHLEAVLKETSCTLVGRWCCLTRRTTQAGPAGPWAPAGGGGSPDCSLACRLRLPSLNHNQQADCWVRSPAARLVRRGVKRRMAAAAKKVGAHWLRGAIAQPRPRGSTPLPSGAVWCWPQTSCCCVGRKRASRRA